MGLKDKKLEIAMFALAVVMAGGMGRLLKNPVQAVMTEAADIVYEMPRPKNSILSVLFDLSDRLVTRKYVNPFAKKKKKDVKQMAHVPAKPPVLAPQKTAQKKKVEEGKKTEPAGPKVDVQIVGADPSSPDINEVAAFPTVAAVKTVRANTNNQNAPAENQPKNIVSGNQWRALVLAHPTEENVNKLVQAYKSKEVDDTTFYMIVTDLFRDNKVENQKLGLLAVKSTYSAKSFSTTAQYFDQLAPEVQESANTYLMSYAVTSRLPVLMQTLESSNTEVVATATQVVIEGYQKAKNGIAPGQDPRTLRGDVGMNATSSYSRFLPIFQQLALSSDTVIATLATTALSQIQISVAAL